MKSIELKLLDGSHLWINIAAIVCVHGVVNPNRSAVLLQGGVTFEVDHQYHDVLNAIAYCVAQDSQ